jgi:mandelate racemase
VGYQGLAMVAVSGLDMAAWDALAKAAGLPLCMFLGGTVGPVKAYNSNGLWLRDPEQVTEEAIELRNEEGFTALKLRLGREMRGMISEPSTLSGSRSAMRFRLMLDFNQGLDLSEALHRCHAIVIWVSSGSRSRSFTTILTASRGFLPN